MHVLHNHPVPRVSATVRDIPRDFKPFGSKKVVCNQSAKDRYRRAQFILFFRPAADVD